MEWLGKQAPKDRMKLQARLACMCVYVCVCVCQVRSSICLFFLCVYLHQELKLPADELDFEVRKAKFSSLGAAKYVMQMGLTASARLEEAASNGEVPAKTLEHSRKQVVTILENGMRLAFRCHQFAGGLDKESASLFHQVREHLEAAC